MYYNVSYDFISLVVLLVLTVRFYSLKKFPLFSNLMYGVLLILGIVNLSLDILGSFAVAEGSTIPIWLAYIPNVLYYIAQLALSASLVLYLIALLANKKTIKRSSYLFSLIPFGICFTVFVVGILFGQVFVITPDHGYEYGMLSFITYACVGIYLVLMFTILMLRRQYFNKRDLFSICILGGFVILAAIIQKIFPQQLLTGSAIAVALLIMYFSIQDPQMMLDATTGLFNVRAFTQLIDYGQIFKAEYYVAAFKLHGLHNIFMLNGRETGDIALKKMGDYLRTFKTGWSFRTGDAVFVTCFESECDLQDFVRQFDANRTVPVLLDRIEVIPILTLVVINHADGINNTKEFLTVISNAFDKRNIAGIKNRTTYLSKHQIEMYRRNVVIENDITQNLKDGKNFQVYYQPIFSMAEGRFVSVEALVRYKSATLGRLSPAEFIPMIEYKGLAPELDEIVVKKVFTHMEEGVFRGLQLNSLHINLSASTFSSEKSVENILNLAKRYDIDRSKIIFEITETATTLSDDTLEKCANLLREEGFGIALDDFGVGYANIGRLYKLPFTAVKLDKCVVNESANIFKEIAGIFKTFDMDIVAEGVETAEQVELVVQAGVDLIQGFYYSTPLPTEELIQLIKDHQTRLEETAQG